MASLEAHVGDDLFSVMVVNDNIDVDFDAPPGVEMVSMDMPSNAKYRVVAADLVDESRPWRHDSHKLARTLLYLLNEQRPSHNRKEQKNDS
jgi:hypothetical protein